MNYDPLAKQFWLVLAFVGVIIPGAAQNVIISLEEAVRIASSKYAGLGRDRLLVLQQNKLAESGTLMPPTQIFFSGEEFNFNDQSGVQSFNIQQNFNLPKKAKAQKEYYHHSALLAQRQLELTEQELKYKIKLSYYRLQHAKREQALAIENQKLYGDFLALTTTLLEKGETGKLPQLSARSHLGKAQLEREHANEKYQIAFHLFNQWLRSDTLYDVEEQVDIIQPVIVDTNLTNNPHLQVIQAKQELAVANVEIQKVKLLPQINSGLRLQNAFGTFPLFGYQIGANVPLFQKSYKKRIEAAEVGVKAQQSALKTEQQHLEQTLSELNYRIEHQLHILEYLQQDLQPIVDQQSELSLQAFQEGEISYLEYLDSLEQVLNVKKQYLEALYQFNLLRLELDYWLGK